MSAADILNQSLTIENFIQKIKDMDNRDRNRLKAEVLVKLIIQLPSDTNDTAKTIQDILVSVNQTQKIALENSQEITKLKDENVQIKKINAELSTDIRKLNDDNSNLKSHIENIDTYLRVNNLEISGLDKPISIPATEVEEAYEEPVEDMVVKCLNGLFAGEERISNEDIDICHELPSKTGKKLHVVKFISRKAKNLILDQKKKRQNFNFKFRGNPIFINDHLTPNNKHLFAMARQKKTAAGYKYLWTKNGKILIRKDDNSPIIPITSMEVIATL